MTEKETPQNGERVFIAHVSEDNVRAKRIATELLKSGVELTLFDVDKQSFDASLWHNAECAVVLLTSDSVQSSSMHEFLKASDAERLRWVPVRSGRVEISKQIGYYLHIAQWLDVDEVDQREMAALANAIANNAPTAYAVGAQNSGSPRKIVTSLVGLGLIALLGIGAFVWGLMSPRKTAEPETATKATEKSSSGLVHAFVSDDGGIPWFNPVGGEISVSLTLPDVQAQGVEYSYYEQDGKVFNLLGSWQGVPKIAYGQQSFEFEVAQATKDGVGCLIYNRTLADETSAKYGIVRNIANWEEPDQVHRAIAEGETCEKLVGGRVSRDKMANLIKRKAVLRALGNGRLPLVDGLKYNGDAWQIAPSVSPSLDATIYLLGGETPNALNLLLRMKSTDGYTVYQGTPPAHILVCINSITDGWHNSSFRRGTLGSDNRYKMGSMTLKTVRDINTCNSFVTDESQFLALQKWPNAKTLVPQGTQRRFDEDANKATPMLAGLALGLPFDEAVASIVEQFPNFSQREGDGRTIFRGTALDNVEHYDQMFTPNLVFKNGKLVEFSTKNPEARIVLAQSEKSGKLGAVYIEMRPDLTLLQNKNPFVGSERFIKDLKEALGPPSRQIYKGVFYAAKDEDLRMIWATTSDKRGCWTKKTELPVMGTGGRSSIVERWKTLREGFCPHHLEVRYLRKNYNGWAKFMLIDSAL